MKTLKEKIKEIKEKIEVLEVQCDDLQIETEQREFDINNALSSIENEARNESDSFNVDFEVDEILRAKVDIFYNKKEIEKIEKRTWDLQKKLKELRKKGA